ncbi:MAG: dTDP-4-dehydrorhamnose reductase [Hydrogenophilales bacterium]|nr:dTDP-4-dehydrorhamnose reductase [Hydrogenophilales bacterium]
MKILITGANGQVGWELQRTLAPLGEVMALGRDTLDLANPDAIRKALRQAAPDLIVNAAAYTAVDKAEEERELAHAVNGIAPGVLAEEAKLLNAALVHYSTDYVFDGLKGAPYEEIDAPHPLSVYGETKLAGEKTIAAVGAPHLILRTSWVYGARGKNFLRTMLRLANERDELRVVDDQLGAPTWSRMIAEATSVILSQCLHKGAVAGVLAEKGGLYHLTAAGQTTWFGFASEIVKQVEKPPRMTPITTAEYPLPAPRPAYSVMSNAKLARVFGIRLPDWNTSLAHCAAELKA